MNDVSNTPAFDLSARQADNDELFRLAVEACPAGVILVADGWRDRLRQRRVRTHVRIRSQRAGRRPGRRARSDGGARGAWRAAPGLCRDAGQAAYGGGSRPDRGPEGRIPISGRDRADPDAERRTPRRARLRHRHLGAPPGGGARASPQEGPRARQRESRPVRLRRLSRHSGAVAQDRRVFGPADDRASPKTTATRSRWRAK